MTPNINTPFSIDGRPAFILGGQVHNSSGYGPESMETAWKALEALCANTAEVPVYWEQVEPREGEFEFAHLDGIISGARQRGLKLVLLWFATWKNGSMEYAPEWVKTDPERFWPVYTSAGNPIWVLSSHCPATWEADRKAFCRLMAHLREVDDGPFGDQRTVISVQVQNEPGILGAVRDYSPAAEAEFNDPVPMDLVNALPNLPASPTRAAWEQQGSPSAGNWPEVFGPAAAEQFSAWSIARYIDRLAQAGKEIYNLPMYANVWLGENGWRLPGANYPSGGPVSFVLDLWKLAAPHLDLIAPDIYLQPAADYRAICQNYSRADNPLFIPESGGGVSNAINMFEAIARWGAVGYAVFGIESLLSADGSVRSEALPLVESFRTAAAVLPLIERFHGEREGKLHAVAQCEFMSEQLFDFGQYLGLVRFYSNSGQIFTDFRHRPLDTNQRGRGLIITPGPLEFYAAGAGFYLTLKKKHANERFEFSKSSDHFDSPMNHYLRVEEGHFSPQGDWIVDRLRNGDEITNGLWVSPEAGIVRAVMAD
jgi:hypothetical protein